MRRLNVARVFETVRLNGPITRQLIGEISGLSKPTVNEALEVLFKEDLILSSVAKIISSDGKPGPKAKQISFNALRKKIVAIDIGGSKIRILLADLDGNIIASLVAQTPLTAGRNKILEKIKDISFARI